MIFQRLETASWAVGMTVYAAKAQQWQFLIIQDMGKWTASYRLINPKMPVSASSTIMGPFDNFADAVHAAESKLTELRRLA